MPDNWSPHTQSSADYADAASTEEEARGLISRDERLLWNGRPKRGLMLRSTDAFMIPFSIIWFGFSIFWVSIVAAGGGGAFALFGIPFLAVGLYITVGRFFTDARIRGRTLYALTDQRAIIASGLLNRQTKSLSLRTMTDVTLQEQRRGHGTITLGRSTAGGFWPQGLSWPGVDLFNVPCFESIPDARAVFELLRKAQEESFVPKSNT